MAVCFLLRPIISIIHTRIPFFVENKQPVLYLRWMLYFRNRVLLFRKFSADQTSLLKSISKILMLLYMLQSVILVQKQRMDAAMDKLLQLRIIKKKRKYSDPKEVTCREVYQGIS